MRQVLTAACLGWLLVVAATQAGAAEYGYPIEDGYEATIVGTPPALRADLGPSPDWRLFRLDVFPGREISDADYVWYLDKLRYVLMYQEGPAPLVFVIAGTGSAFHGPRMNILTRTLYAAGFHVVALTNPTHMEFIATASEHSVPGLVSSDAKDLYRVMKLAWETQLKDRLEVTGFSLAGYSLGGTLAGWIGEMDSREKYFDFERILMINPAVNLYSSAGILDGFLEKASSEDVKATWERLMGQLADTFRRDEGIEFSEESIIAAFRDNRPDDRDMELLIGVAFRLSAQSMIVAADRMTRFGFIIPPEARVEIGDNVDAAFLVSARTGLLTYFDQMLVPFYQARDPGLSRARAIAEAGLEPIREWLSSDPRVGVVHNADDIILGEGEIAWLEEVLGSRAKIWPRGGHCGNMAYRENVSYVQAFMRGETPP
jgi:hypothetical protein